MKFINLLFLVLLLNQNSYAGILSNSSTKKELNIDCIGDKSKDSLVAEPLIAQIKQYQASNPDIRLSFDEQTLLTSLKKYNVDKSACSDAFNSARNICILEAEPYFSKLREKINPDIAQIATGAATIALSCQKIGKVFQVIEGGLLAYQTACGYKKYSCTNSCAAAIESGKAARAQLDKFNISFATPASTCAEASIKCKLAQTIDNNINILNKDTDYSQNVPETYHGVSCNRARCEAYGTQLLYAMADFAVLMSARDKAKQCENNSSSNMCDDKNNAQKAECICLNNPRTTGCASVTNPITGEKFGALGTLSDVASGGAGGDLSTPVGGDSGLNPTAAAPDGIGQPGSGGATGIDGGGGLGPGPSKPGGGGNGGGRVLSMEEGGGGGGGGFRGGSSSGRDRSSLMDLLKSNSKYSNYLPGGKEDPSRLPASGGVSEISSKTGPSNWDKVRNQYISNQYKMYNGE